MTHVLLESTCLDGSLPQDWDYRIEYYHAQFIMGAGDLGLGARAYAVRILPTKPSPQSLKLIWIKPSNVAGLGKSVHKNQM